MGVFPIQAIKSQILDQDDVSLFREETQNVFLFSRSFFILINFFPFFFCYFKILLEFKKIVIVPMERIFNARFNVFITD